MDINEKKSPFTVYIAEGEKLYKAGDYKKAVEAFTDAIELEPLTASTFVNRSKCYLAMGEAEKALSDAEESLKNDQDYHRGIYQKAEALYSLGQFEFALVFYHRGQKLRPELSIFRLGVQKAREAIINSVGTPKSVNLRSKTGIATPLANVGSSERKNNISGGSRDPRRGTLSGHEAGLDLSKKDRSGSGSRKSSGATVNNQRKQKTAKAVLGEMYPDKAFLMKLLDDEELMKGNVSNGMNIHSLILSGLNYLDTRTDFWQQHKPIYARKRDRLLMQQKWNAAKDANGGVNDKAVHMLSVLEKVEELIEKSEPVEALKSLENMTKKYPVEEQNPSDACHTLGLLGLAQVDIGNYTEALKNHKRELRLAEKNSLDNEKSRALDNLGRVYARLGKFDKAIEAWTIKLPLAENNLEKTWLHHELGRCFFEMGKNEEAISHGLESFKFAEEAKDSTWQINSKVLLAESHQKSGQESEALTAFNEALELSKFYNDQPAKAAIEKALAGIGQKLKTPVEGEA